MLECIDFDSDEWTPIKERLAVLGFGLTPEGEGLLRAWLAATPAARAEALDVLTKGKDKEQPCTTSET